jgi:hypothetical protein
VAGDGELWAERRWAMPGRPGMPQGPKVLARYGDSSFNQMISAEMMAKNGFSCVQVDEYPVLSQDGARRFPGQ